MEKSIVTKKRKEKIRRKDLIFYVVLIAFPVAHFCVFYLSVNINSILLSFKSYNISQNTVSWVGLANIKAAFGLLQGSVLSNALKNSGMVYVLLLLISVPLALVFSYYIGKKLPVSGLFRVLLFLPGILSAIVMVTIFKSFAERVVPEIYKIMTGKTIRGLIESGESRMATLIFYSIWAGFGVTVLMYSNAISAIPVEITEAGKLDGVNGIKEFWYLTFPMIYPTIVTFIITGIAGIFTNQLNLYSFYGAEAPESVYTMGYWMFVKTKQATDFSGYPILSSMGIMMTLVAVPVTLVVKALMEKFGPSEN